MLILVGHATTPDELEVVTSAAADVDVHVSHIDSNVSAPPVPENPAATGTLIATAATTVVATAPTSASKVRNVKHVNIRNRDTADTTDVTVQIDANASGANVIELFKETLEPGEVLEYHEGIGWFKVANEARLDKMLVTTADVVNATTSWADITGLTYPVQAGKTYVFEVALLAIANATTTGLRFGVNGPASPTYLRLGGIGTALQEATGGTGSRHTTAASAVSAYDTAATGAQTTGPATEVPFVFWGAIVPSAAGTFAVRSQSEVAVAAGLTVRRGAWLHLREADNT